MRLTTFSDYSLRVLMYLALDRNRLATIPEIAAAYGISQNHLMKVAHQLARGGVIESVRGKGGGLRLAHAPEAIRIGAIVRAAEGDAPIVECLSGKPGGCRIAPVCKLTRVLKGAFDALYESLDRYTLADLMVKRKAIASILVTLPTARAGARRAPRRAPANRRA